MSIEHKSKKMQLSRRIGLAGTALALSAVLAGCSHNESGPATGGGASLAPSGPQGGAQQADNGAASSDQTPQGAGSSEHAVVAYKLAQNGDNSSSDTSADANGLAATPVKVRAGSQSPARAALLQLTQGENSPLPEGTKLLGVKIDSTQKLATVNFSEEFKSNFHGGDTAEARVVDSVLETLGQFDNVQKVQFLVDGKKIDSLGGAQDLSDPLPTPQSTRQVASNTGGAGGQ